MTMQIPTTVSGDALAALSVAAGGAVIRPVSVPTLPAQAQPAAAADTQAAQSPTSAAQLQKAIEEVKKVTQPVAQNLQFSVDKETGNTVIRVVDESTQELIRQIPSQEFLDMVKSLDNLAGLLFKQKA
ncbi:MAG: flagellar protein FlaG [Rhodocyclaceae bacterium]|nr:MAG: flagellar protein FlaG [Rhodocyclaceae bacterium]